MTKARRPTFKARTFRLHACDATAAQPAGVYWEADCLPAGPFKSSWDAFKALRSFARSIGHRLDITVNCGCY